MPIPDFNTDFNVQSLVIEPYVFVDTASGNTYYIGTSRSFSNQNAPNWRIKKIWQNGTVWMSGYPDGDQSFNYAWSGRTSTGHTYQ